jgi:tetratricopeptide (TPR) repeat protein
VPQRGGLPVESLEVRAARDSLDAHAHFNLAMAYLSRERYDRADSALRRAVSLDQQFAEAHLALSVAQDRNRRYWNQLRRSGGESAVATERLFRARMMRKAFLLDPLVDLRSLVFADERSGVVHPAMREMAMMTSGYYLYFYRMMDYYLSRELRHHNDQRDSVPASLLWFHGLAAARAGQGEAAIADLAALVRLSAAWEQGDSLEAAPLRTNEFRYMLAALNQRLGRRATALALYSEVLTHDAGNYMAYVRLAELHEAGEEWSQAVRTRRAATDANPDDPALLRQLAETLRRAGRLEEAETAMLRAREASPRDPLVHYGLGLLMHQRGRHSEAREALTAFLAIAPSRLAIQVGHAREILAGLP